MIDQYLWLVGAGKMSQNYFDVLRKLNITPKVIGRGLDSAKKFKKKKIYMLKLEVLN